jgi:hypothetical protein
MAFRQSWANWLKCDEALRAGLAVEPENADLNRAMGWALATVGRQHEGLTFMRRSVVLDPLSPGKTDEFIMQLAFDGRLAEAREMLDRAERVWSSHNDFIVGARFTLAARYGDPAGALAIVQQSDDQAHSQAGGAHLMWRRVLTALQSPTQENVDAAAAIIMQRAKTPEETGIGPLVNQLAVIGRLDDAFALAERDPGHLPAPAEDWMSFRSYMAPFRADPRFMPLVYHQGLVDIWMKTGKWPDFCVDKTVPYDCETEARRLMAQDNRTENLSGNR